MSNQAALQVFEQRFSQLSELLRRAPVSLWRSLLIAIALLWITHNLARLIWLMFPAPDLPLPPVLAVNPNSNVAQQSAYKVDIEALQQQDIFGEGNAAEVVIEPEPVVSANIDENAEKTKLKLKLVGLLNSTNRSHSAAIIASGPVQKIYQLDDKLPGGTNVTLARILSDRVILDNNGNFESLWLYTDEDLSVKQTYPVARPKGPGPDYAGGRPVPYGNKGAQAQQEVGGQAVNVPESISEVVRFSVHREEGETVGFRLRPGRNRELFDQLGLQVNDVVTAVNGIAVNSNQAIRDNYQQFKSATSADLEIRRGDEVVYINVSLDAISE